MGSREKTRHTTIREPPHRHGGRFLCPFFCEFLRPYLIFLLMIMLTFAGSSFLRGADWKRSKVIFHFPDGNQRISICCSRSINLCFFQAMIIACRAMSIGTIFLQVSTKILSGRISGHFSAWGSLLHHDQFRLLSGHINMQIFSTCQGNIFHLHVDIIFIRIMNQRFTFYVRSLL